jgi:hypothetical protein
VAPEDLEPPPGSASSRQSEPPGEARVTADYRFENSLDDSVGVDVALSALGANASRFIDDVVFGDTHRVLSFDRGSGLTLTPASAFLGAHYTIELVLRFDRLDGYVKILDFKDGRQDCGLYALDGRIDFYPIATSGTPALEADSYAHVVLTRDATDNVIAYVNGVTQLSFHDTGNLAVIGSRDTLRLFGDDAVTSNEDSAGAVSRIRLYNRPLTAGEVAALAAEFGAA